MLIAGINTRLGFENKNIVTLRNSEATFSRIIAGLSSLEEELKTDDVVYIHFSGHGQQITDFDSDEKDGYDEAWIPYDALQEPTPYYNGEFHLTDDILNNILHKLKEKVGKNGKIIVVADACHSGTSTRDITDDSIIRGSSAKFISTSNKNTIKNERSTEWITISACADNEVNRQCRIGNSTSYGSLSYALYKLRYKLGKLTLSEEPFNVDEVQVFKDGKEVENISVSGTQVTITGGEESATYRVMPYSFETDAEAETITIKAQDFPSACKVVLNGVIRDQNSKITHIVNFIFDRAKAQNDWSIETSSELSAKDTTLTLKVLNSISLTNSKILLLIVSILLSTR